ncbi:MAG: thiol-activated cytolysin family protein [Phaeodactylibacter sp.]|nr:thiol-activated cytolysin family protein [Phaeodactylibacter sp.]
MKNLFSLLVWLLMASSISYIYGQASTQLEAPYVQSLEIATIGSTTSVGNFEEVTHGLWKSAVGGQTTSYEELNRDQWSIYLKEDDADQAVTINLWTKKVLLGGVEKYSVLESSAGAIPDEPVTQTNIALNKPARQSSTYFNQTDKYGPSFANDGKINGQNKGGEYIMCTEKQDNPWWEVDLTGTYNIRAIKLYNRINCCPDRLANFTILVSDKPFTGNNGGTVFTAKQPAPSGENGSGAYSGNVTGRYVRLFLEGNNYMSVPEIEIYGTLADGANPTVNTPPVNTPPPASASESINKYIYSLNYDARELLSTNEAGSSEAIPTGERKTRDLIGNSVIICRKRPVKLDKKMDNISILKPNSGVIYPGALILADRKLAEGLPTPITLKKSNITLRVDLPGLSQNGTKVIDNPTNSSIQTAINDILIEWNKNPASEGWVNADHSIKSFEKAYSSEQLALDLGFRLDWASNSVAAATKVNTSSQNEVTVAFFQQVFYSITMDTPEKPADVFDPSVSLSDIERVMNAKSPPAYVRSVDYGRTIMVRMETSKKTLEVDLEAALKYAVNPGTVLNADLKSKYASVLENSSFTIYSVGGNGETVSKNLSDGTDLSGLNTIIQKDAVYRKDNPGVPIAYTVAFLKDNVTASVNSSLEYVETDCTEYANAFIKLVHNGAYVGRFTVTWQEPDAQGKYVNKEWKSGEKTSGYTETLTLPGDAVNINIKGEAATGLVWDPWGEAINKVEKGPTNCTYTIFGTTLGRKNKIDCPTD